MFSKVMGDKFYCGVDVGGQKIKAGILKIKDAAQMELIGVYEQKTAGFRDSAVTDLAEFSDCLHQTIVELTGRAGVKLKQVQVGLGAGMVETRMVQASVPLIDRGNKVITSRDIKKVNHHARLLGTKIDEEILYDLPQSYLVDETDSALNPLGLYGRVLGVKSLIVHMNGNRVRNVLKAFHQAGFEPANVFLATYAASDVVLQESDKKGGCVLVDLGAQCSTAIVFIDGVLRGIHRIDVGGHHLTRAISQKLDLPFDLAEEIKESYATILESDRHQLEEILVKKEETYRPIKRGLIYDAIRPHVDQLIGQLKAVTVDSGLKDKAKAAVIMIGGGALLPGLIEMISSATSLPVNLAQVTLPLKKALNYTATFSPVVGLAQNGYRKTFRYSFASCDRKAFGKTVLDRMGDLYQEYF